MSSHTSLFPVAATFTAGCALVAAVFIGGLGVAHAAEPTPTPHAAPPTCTCPGAGHQPVARPKFADLKASFDEVDEIAALESVQFALSEVGDGATYVWHRQHGKLSGLVQPTSSYKNDDGMICRHLVVMLTSGTYSRRREGTACRLDGGRWQLQG